jgi:hypothetical protein
MTYVDEKKSLEVLGRVRNQVLSIGSIDSAISIVDVGVLKLLSGWSVELDAFGSNRLPRGKCERTGLNGISRGHELRGLVSDQIKCPRRESRNSYIGVRFRHVGVRVGVLESLLAGIQRPGGNVHLLSKGGGVRLHERVHVFPAVEVANPTDFSVHYGLGGVASAIAKDKTLDVSSADLATVVDDIAGRADHDLGRVKTGKVELGVSERHPNLVGSGGFTDALHFLGVGCETVLAILLQKWQTLLVSHLPCPVRVAGDP